MTAAIAPTSARRCAAATAARRFAAATPVTASPRRSAARAVTVLALAVVLVTVAAARPAAARPDLFVRALVQTFVVIPNKRGNAYEAIEAQRDADLAAASSLLQVRQYQRDAGLITEAEFTAEAARLDTLRQAITDRAEREKKITRAVYNRAVGDEWRASAEGAVAIALGGQGRLGQLLLQLAQGNDPLSAALQVLGGEKLEKLQQILQGPPQVRTDAADKLSQAQGLLDVLRDPRGELRRTVRQLESMLRGEGGELPAALSDTARQRAEAVVAQWNALRGEWQRLTANRVKVDPQRILNDRQWQQLTQAILDEGSVPLVNRMLLAAGVGPMRERVRAAAEGAELSDAERTSLIVRALAAQLQAERDRAAGLPVVFDIDEFIREQIAAITSTTAPEGTATDTTGPDTSQPADATDTTEAPPADRPTGGGVYVMDATSPSPFPAIHVCADVVERREAGASLKLEGCSTAPRFEVVFDLAEGTVSGWFEADLACPGEHCSAFSTATGSVRGEFGPLPYGQPPVEVPADFPFPAHHWYPPSDTYWAGGPIQLDLSLQGETDWGGGTKIPGSITATVTGWVDSDLGWMRKVAGAPPEGWRVDFGVSIDQPEDAQPRWYLYFGQTYELPEERGLTLPPWEQ